MWEAAKSHLLAAAARDSYGHLPELIDFWKNAVASGIDTGSRNQWPRTWALHHVISRWSGGDFIVGAELAHEDVP